MLIMKNGKRGQVEGIKQANQECIQMLEEKNYKNIASRNHQTSGDKGKGEGEFFSKPIFQ